MFRSQLPEAPVIDIDIILLVLKIGIVALLYLFVWRVVRAAVTSVRGGAAAGQAPDVPVSSAIPLSVAALEGGGPQPLAASRQPRLVVESSPDMAVDMVLSLDGELAIGRSPANDVVLDETVVSGRHARVFQRGHLWFVEDLGSTNGTFVDGLRVAQAELRDGSRLRIGDTVFFWEG